MINRIRKNKLLSIMLLLTLISYVLGVIFTTLIGNDSKKVISNNINLLINNKLLDFQDIFINNILLTIIIWILGISIIGIIIILFIYIFKVLLFSFESICLISNLGIKNILLIAMYLLPNLINIIIYFIICYYSITYSYYLIKHIFLNTKYNMYQITKKYIIVLIISILVIVVSSFIEMLILSNLSSFKI